MLQKIQIGKSLYCHCTIGIWHGFSCHSNCAVYSFAVCKKCHPYQLISIQFTGVYEGYSKFLYRVMRLLGPEYFLCCVVHLYLSLFFRSFMLPCIVLTSMVVSVILNTKHLLCCVFVVLYYFKSFYVAM